MLEFEHASNGSGPLPFVDPFVRADNHDGEPSAYRTYRVGLWVRESGVGVVRRA